MPPRWKAAVGKLNWNRPPQRAVSNDSNMTEMMLALELEVEHGRLHRCFGVEKNGGIH